MSTATIVTLGFRCKKCWQLTSATSDQVGLEVPCICCQSPTIVPEVDEKLIAAGEEMLASAEAVAPSPFDLEDQLAEAYAAPKVQQTMPGEPGPIGLPATRLMRFLGSFVDGIAVTVASFAGFLLAMIIAPEAGLASTITILTLPFMLVLIQCNLIATEGRTIGKYCVGTRIINNRGEAPGFVQGVLLRVVATACLGAIPFFSLVDALWIFTNDTNRCLHDLLAGTTVVDA